VYVIARLIETGLIRVQWNVYTQRMEYLHKATGGMVFDNRILAHQIRREDEILRNFRDTRSHHAPALAEINTKLTHLQGISTLIERGNLTRSDIRTITTEMI